MFAYILAAMHLGLRHAVTSEIQVYSTRPKVLGQAWHMGPRRAGPPRTGRRRRWPSSAITAPASPQEAPRLRSCTTASRQRSRTAASAPWASSTSGRGSATAVSPPDCAGPLEEYHYRNERLLEVQRNTSEALKTRISAFMLRAVASSVWEALEHYKLEACGDDRGGWSRRDRLPIRSSGGGDMTLPRHHHHHPLPATRRRRRHSRTEDDRQL